MSLLPHKPMMDRNKAAELPKLQVGFIDFVCTFVYKVSGVAQGLAGFAGEGRGMGGGGGAGGTVAPIPLESALGIEILSVTPRGPLPISPPSFSLPERPPAHLEVVPQMSLPKPRLRRPCPGLHAVFRALTAVYVQCICSVSAPWEEGGGPLSPAGCTQPSKHPGTAQ